MSALRDAIVLKLQATSGVTSLATGGIYPGLPPEEDASYPFVTVFAQRAPAPERVFQGNGSAADGIAFEDATYLVKAIDRNISPKTAGLINAAIRTALDGAAITISGHELLNLMWVGDVAYDENDAGTTYQHEGGFYELWAKAN